MSFDHWEYKTLTFGPNGCHDLAARDHELAQEGAKGWEMVGSERDGIDLTIYMKRRVPAAIMPRKASAGSRR